MTYKEASLFLKESDKHLSLIVNHYVEEALTNRVFSKKVQIIGLDET
jgi:hypothetical protein